MSVTPLNSRRNKILQAIVERYIQTGAAVSSRAIAQLLRSRISAATVRNVMAELDELGLIGQPHTSAGRIPTDKGYRYYIDSLLEVERLTQRERQLIQKRYHSGHQVFDDLLTELLRLLANFTGYTAIAFSSGLRKILFKRLEFVSVESMKLLVVLVSPEGMVKTTVVHLPYAVEQSELFKIARFLTEEFSGLSLNEIKQRLTGQLLNSSDSFFHLAKSALDILDFTFANLDEDRLYLEGADYIFAQPEFQDRQKLQTLLKVLQKQKPLLTIMKEDLSCDGVRVLIGKENPCQDIQECSLVISNYKNRNLNMGALGVIGPRRMAYAKVIAAVGYVADIFSNKA